MEPAASASRTRRLARWSLILGATALVTAVIGVGVVFAFAAVLCSTIVLNRLRPWQPHDGHAVALAGLLFGGAALLVFPLLAATLLPTFLAARQRQHHQACLQNLETIQAAKAEWVNQRGAARKTVVPPGELFAAGGPLPEPPLCPGGGKYRLNPAGIPPRCSIALHNERPSDR